MGELGDCSSQSNLGVMAWSTHAMEERLAAYKGGKAWQGDLFGS